MAQDQWTPLPIFSTCFQCIEWRVRDVICMSVKPVTGNLYWSPILPYFTHLWTPTKTKRKSSLHVFHQQGETAFVQGLFLGLHEMYSRASIQLSPLWKIFMMIYSRTSSGNVDNLKQNPCIAPSNKQSRDTRVFLTSNTGGITSPEQGSYFICGLQDVHEGATIPNERVNSQCC